MKKVILGVALLSQFAYGMGGTPEFTNASEMRSKNFVRVDSSRTFPLYGSEEYAALIGANDENTEEGTIWKFIRGLGGYSPETGKNALNTVLSSHGYLNALINSDNLSWENLKSLVDAESNEDRKAWAVYSAFAKALIDQHDNEKENLIRNLKKQQKGILESIAMQYNEKLKRMEETGEQKETLLQEMIDELTALKSKLEKEKELHERISRVFIANPSLRPEKITVKSADIIQQTDLWPRYNTAKGCYDKFVLFSELFSNKEELPKIGSYLDQLGNLLPQFEHIMKCDVHWGDLFDAYGDMKEFARSRNYRQWCGNHSMDDLYFRLGYIHGNEPLRIGLGGLGFRGHFLSRSRGYGKPGCRYGWMDPNVDYYSHQIGHIIMEDFNRENERRQRHNEELHRQALSINFPAGEFDRFVEQFNMFLSKL